MTQTDFTQRGTSMSVINDPSGTLLLASVTDFMELAAGWSVVVQRHHTFTVESCAVLFVFFSPPRSKTTHKTGQSLKMSDKMPLSKALNPGEQHRSCSLATNKEIFWKLCGADRNGSRRFCFLKNPLWPAPPSERGRRGALTVFQK